MDAADVDGAHLLLRRQLAGGGERREQRRHCRRVDAPPVVAVGRVGAAGGVGVDAAHDVEHRAEALAHRAVAQEEHGDRRLARVERAVVGGRRHRHQHPLQHVVLAHRPADRLGGSEEGLAVDAREPPPRRERRQPHERVRLTC